ncbi:MAG TPA: energy transducer TonB [Draconibacterium sp.]|nr:energy transducer TonB [Draconibacterium sp.]
MKTNLFFAAGMLIAAIATGQNKELTAIEVTPPSFKSEVPKSISDFLQKNVEYPPEASVWKHQGTEVVQFVITPEGKLTDFTVINSVSPDIDKEVIRVLELTSGSWMPGTINGEPASMETEVSMVFMLNPKDDFVEIAKCNMKKGNELLFVKDNPKRALKYFDWAMNYLPHNETIHAIRGLCKYRLGDENGAESDWQRANLLAERNGKDFDFKNLAVNSNNLEDFERMLNYVEK